MSERPMSNDINAVCSKAEKMKFVIKCFEWLFSEKRPKKPVNQIVQCREQLYEFAKRLEKTNRR